MAAGIAFPQRVVQTASHLGCKARIKWQQTADGLTLTASQKLPCQTAVVFKIQ